MSLLKISQEGLYDFRAPLLKGNINDAIEKAKERKALGEEWRGKLKASLEAIIRTQFNINMVFVWNEAPLGLQSLAITNFNVITSSNLQLDSLRRYSDEEHAKGTGIRAIEANYSGWIDEKNQKVGGLFAKIPVFVTINKDVLNFDTNYFGVILLHEVGHYLEYVWTVANQYRYLSIVESLIRGIRGSKNEVTAAKFVKDTMGNYGVTIEDPEELKSARKDESIRTVLLCEYPQYYDYLTKEARSIFRTEMLADDLPAAIYGPKETAAALATIYDAVQKSNLVRNAAIVVAIEAIGISIYGVAFAALTIPTVLVLGAFLIAANLPVAHPGMDERIRHLRNRLQSEAKKPRLTKEELETLTAGVNTLNEMIKRYDTVGSRFKEMLAKNFFEFRRRHVDVHELDMQYEELSMNPLYLRAHQLNAIKEQ